MSTNIRLPGIFLLTSILFLITALITLYIGSMKSSIYYQMKEQPIYTSVKELETAETETFLLHGFIERNHKTVKSGLIATTKIHPELTITLEDGEVLLAENYKLADFNKTTDSINGIKPGSDITIFAINHQDDNFTGVKGHELYPGNPKQYITFLNSPYTIYRLYVRILIGVAILFFTTSVVLNVKK